MSCAALVTTAFTSDLVDSGQPIQEFLHWNGKTRTSVPKRPHSADRERLQERRQSGARRGRVRLELQLDHHTAEWIRQEARESRKTVGEVVTHLINREIILRRSTAESAAGFEVLHMPETDR